MSTTYATASINRDGAQAAELKATVKGTASTPQGNLPHAFLKLATYPDSMAGEHGKDGDGGANQRLHDPSPRVVRSGAAHREDE